MIENQSSAFTITIIPVRIDFTNLSKEDNEKLAAGMMVIVKAEL